MNPNPDQSNLKPFGKGEDPRRNTEGRPSVKKLTAALVSKLEEGDGKGYEELMKKLFDMAKGGNLKAIQTILDRVEGKVPQGLEHTGGNGEPLFSNITVNIKRSQNDTGTTD